MNIKKAISHLSKEKQLEFINQEKIKIKKLLEINAQKQKQIRYF